MGQHDPIVSVLLDGLQSQVFPGAALLVRRSGKILVHQGIGRLTFDPHSPSVCPNTIYDLASLTKPLATASALLLLTQDNVVKLSQPLESVLQEAEGSVWGNVPIKALLSHHSGLPAWRPFYQEFSGEDVKDSVTRQERMRVYLRRILDEIPEEPLSPAGVYSDLGFMLLGFLIERLTNQSLGEFCRQRLYQPLHAENLFFCGEQDQCKRDKEKGDIAPTEQDPWRGKLLQGEVHDENAAALGGLAGHAGLFGTVEAVGQITQAWLNGYLGKAGLFDSGLVREFVRSQAESSWALGWDTPSQPSSSGQYFSPQSFGHLGFTGTSIWIDPTRDLEVIFLSNRVRPTRGNDAIKSFRPKLHDVIVKSI